MIHPVEPAQRRPRGSDGLEQAQLAHGPEPHGLQDDAGAHVLDDLGPALEQDEVDARAGQRVRGDEAHGAAAHDDDFEAGRNHNLGSPRIGLRFCKK